jgi:MerR family transcriptional regulator, light-induced transcriptional regulator
MELLSTRDVAAWLGVSEATVKRWSDAGMIACIRTPGGHRKFRKIDVRRLVEGNDAAGTPVAPQDPQPGLSADALLLRGKVHGAAALIESRGLTAEAIAETCDTIFAPALAEVGRRWAAGELSVADEHIAANTATEAIAHTYARIPAPPPDAPCVLFACAGNERHDLGLRMARLVLHASGFATLLFGAMMPVAELIVLMQRLRPAALALSAAAGADPIELQGQLDLLSSAALPLGVTLVVGGAGFQRVESLPIGAGRTSTLMDLLHFARTRLQNPRVSTPTVS